MNFLPSYNAQLYAASSKAPGIIPEQPLDSIKPPSFLQKEENTSLQNISNGELWFNEAEFPSLGKTVSLQKEITTSSPEGITDKQLFQQSLQQNQAELRTLSERVKITPLETPLNPAYLLEKATESTTDSLSFLAQQKQALDLKRRLLPELYQKSAQISNTISRRYQMIFETFINSQKNENSPKKQLPLSSQKMPPLDEEPLDELISAEEAHPLLNNAATLDNATFSLLAQARNLMLTAREELRQLPPLQKPSSLGEKRYQANLLQYMAVSLTIAQAENILQAARQKRLFPEEPSTYFEKNSGILKFLKKTYQNLSLVTEKGFLIEAGAIPSEENPHPEPPEFLRLPEGIKNIYNDWRTQMPQSPSLKQWLQKELRTTHQDFRGVTYFHDYFSQENIWETLPNQETRPALEELFRLTLANYQEVEKMRLRIINKIIQEFLQDDPELLPDFSSFKEELSSLTVLKKEAEEKTLTTAEEFRQKMEENGFNWNHYQANTPEGLFFVPVIRPRPLQTEEQQKHTEPSESEATPFDLTNCLIQ